MTHSIPFEPWLGRQVFKWPLIAFALLATPAQAATPVDLELVLAVDASYSMDTAEQAAQRKGYIKAFLDPEVIDAITSGTVGRIAITYLEWGGKNSQVVRVPWTVIDGRASAESVAKRLSAASYEPLGHTSISAALLFAAKSLATPDFVAPRRVIDISGDGSNNDGLPVTSARDAVVAKGIVINGLPILINPRYSDDFFDVPDLDVYYEDCVIGGAGAFVIPITASSHFVDAIRRKLVSEISQGTDLTQPLPVVAHIRRVDCFIGIKL